MKIDLKIAAIMNRRMIEGLPDAQVISLLVHEGMTPAEARQSLKDQDGFMTPDLRGPKEDEA